MLQMCCIRFGVAKFYFMPQIVNWHDLGTPPGIVKSDTCRTDQHRDPTPKHILGWQFYDLAASEDAPFGSIAAMIAAWTFLSCTFTAAVSDNRRCRVS
jgi:hypothetical protein